MKIGFQNYEVGREVSEMRGLYKTFWMLFNLQGNPRTGGNRD